MRRQLTIIAMAGMLAASVQAHAATRPAQTNFAHAVVNIDEDPAEEAGWWQENGWLMIGLGLAVALGLALAAGGGSSSSGGNSPT